MTIKKLVKELCKREGLKKQVDIAQMTEVVGHLCDIAWEDYEVKKDDPKSDILITSKIIDNGEKRAKRKNKK